MEGLTRGELCNMLVRQAKEYYKDLIPSIERNEHMHDFRGEVDQTQARAVLIGYVNYVAGGQCLDLGLYSKDLEAL